VPPKSTFNRKAFATRLRDAIAESGHRQGDVAAAIGVNPNRLSEWCTARQAPKLHQVVELAEHLGTEIGWLLTGRSAVGIDADVVDELVRATPVLRALAERGSELGVGRAG
jgi:transcriptional regulator with XRE-family HTH domain